MQEIQEVIKTVSEELLKKIGFSAQINISQIADDNQITTANTITVDWEIPADDSKFIIGRHGANLIALQHLLRILVRKKIEQPINLNLDINQYKAQQSDRIIHLSQEIAARVTAEGKPIILEPMNSFERRLVHIQLEDFKGVKTESIGEGEERKVVIKPESVGEELEL